MASVTVRVDDETKEAAAAIAEDFGFDLSSVTRAFYKQMIRENRIPLNLSYGEPNNASSKRWLMPSACSKRAILDSRSPSRCSRPGL